MSKASHPQDLRNHAHESGRVRRPGWCRGCGLHHAVTGEHRADCTTLPPPCETCLYYPAMNDGRHRDDCPAARS